MQNKFFIATIAFFMGILFAYIFTSVFKENKTEIQKKSSVEVSAKEVARFAADEYVVKAYLEIRDKDKDSISIRMEEGRKRLYAIADELEISHKNILPGSVDLQKEWSYKESSRILSGYKESQTFLITVNNKNTASILFEALSLEHDFELERTEARLKNKDSLQAKLIESVGKRALQNAKLYASGVNAAIGKVLYITSGDESSNEFLQGNAPVMLTMRTGNAPTNVVADSVELSASVRLVVELQ